MYSHHAGFTLIELMVVVSMIVVMIMGVTVLFIPAQKRARDTTRLREVRELQKAIAIYYTDQLHYPISASEVAIHGTDPVSVMLLESTVAALQAPLQDPNYPTLSYYYTSDSAGSTYQIRFCLETADMAPYTATCNNVITP